MSISDRRYGRAMAVSRGWLVCMALFAGAGQTSAQSTVQLYGIVDDAQKPRQQSKSRAKNRGYDGPRCDPFDLRRIDRCGDDRIFNGEMAGSFIT